MVQKSSLAFASRFAGIAALAASLAAPALAQTYINATPGGTFNTPANWSGGAVPAFDSTTAIVLNSPSGTGAFGIVNDRAGVSTLNSLTFSSSGTGANYRPITLTASPATNSLEFAGTNPSLVANFTGATTAITHTVNLSVSFAANALITASVAPVTGNLTFGGAGQTFNTNGNTISVNGAGATTAAQGQLNVNLNQSVAGAAKFVVTGGTGSSNGTTAFGGGAAAFNIGTATALASGASAEITLRGGANGTGASAGSGGGSNVQYGASNAAFTPLVIFTNVGGNVNATKVLQLGGFNGTVTGLSSPGQSASYIVRTQAVNSSVLTINNSANYSFGGRVTNVTGTVGANVGTLSLVKNGAGTQTLTGTTTADQLNYSGTTTVNAGVLTFATTVNNTLSGAITVNGGTLNAGSTTGTTLTLSGGVTVNTGGAFNILPGAVVTGALEVNGGTVGGTGTLPAFTLESSAILAPGVGGTGVINAGGLTMDGGSTIAFELSQASPALSDQVALSGAFTRGTAGLYTFDFGATTLSGANTFDLVTFTTGTNFAAGDFTLTGLTSATGFNYNVVVTGTAVQLVSSAVAVVPETGTGVLAALGLLAGVALPVIRRRAAG